RLAARIGRAGLYSVGLILVCSIVVYRVEPASSGFATLGDSVWWGFVTFTTVGYGDLVPVTSTGRIVAVLLMIGGIGLIGVLAGSLAEFWGDTDDDLDDAEAQDDEPIGAGPTAGEIELLAEVRA